MVKAMRDSTAAAPPVVLPADTVEHLVALAELAPEALAEPEEKAALRFARAEVEQARRLAAGRPDSWTQS